MNVPDRPLPSELEAIRTIYNVSIVRLQIAGAQIDGSPRLISQQAESVQTFELGVEQGITGVLDALGYDYIIDDEDYMTGLELLAPDQTASGAAQWIEHEYNAALRSSTQAAEKMDSASARMAEDLARDHTFALGVQAGISSCMALLNWPLAQGQNSGHFCG